MCVIVKAIKCNKWLKVKWTSWHLHPWARYECTDGLIVSNNMYSLMYIVVHQDCNFYAIKYNKCLTVKQTSWHLHP